MYYIFTRILNTSITASILVLAVMFVRFCLKRMPRKFICVLWGFVALRLICPISISSSLSALNLLHEKTDSSGQVEYFQYNEKAEKPELILEVPALVNDDLSTDSMTVGTRTSNIYLPTVMCIWILGIGGMQIYSLIGYYRLRKETKASIVCRDNIYVCDDIHSPFILGVIRPRIYLPSGMSETVKGNVIAHELAHIKRLDYIWKPLGFLLLSVHWFNPVMWGAYVLLCKDIEAACDEKVITGMDKDSIASYSEALLSCASQRRKITACPIAFGETDVRGRVKNIINYKKPAFWILCISVVACIAVGICFLTNPKTGDKGEYELLKEASPESSAMSFYYFDGENTTTKLLFDEAKEKNIIDEINNLKTTRCDSGRINDMTVPCYGLTISDKDGYEIWLTYSNGLWLLKDGTLFEAKYDFEKTYDEISTEHEYTQNGGINMPNAAILGKYDLRYYSESETMGPERDGVSLSVKSVKDNIVTVTIQNNTEAEFCYGTYFSLQKEIDGVWYTLPIALSNYGFTDIACILSPGNSTEETCDLTMYGELSDGHYRIEKEKMAAEFFIGTHGNEKTDVAVPAMDLFSEMAGEYWFLSGAGGWQTRLFLFSDGAFEGLFEDYDAGSVYRCKFHGAFEIPTVVDEYTYASQLKELVYDQPGTVTKEDENMVTTSTPYGLEGSTAITFLAPGTKISDLSNSDYAWLAAEREEFWDRGFTAASDDVLQCFAIKNVTDEETYLFSMVPDAYLTNPGTAGNTESVSNVEPEIECSIPSYLIESFEADVNHDGNLESLDLVLYTEDENGYKDVISSLKYDFCKVIVSNKSLPENDAKIWKSREYSQVHSGNGAMIVTKYNGKEYLLSYNLPIYQGICTGEYSLFRFSPDGGSLIEEAKGEVACSVGEAGASEKLDTYKDEIMKYISDDAYVMIGCDIEADAPVVSGKDEKVSARKYINDALTRTKEIVNEDS